MARQLTRRKVSVADPLGGIVYEVVDRSSGEVVAEVWEGGKSGYRWTVSPKVPKADGTPLKGWDTVALSNAVADLARVL